MLVVGENTEVLVVETVRVVQVVGENTEVLVVEVRVKDYPYLKTRMSVCIVAPFVTLKVNRTTLYHVIEALI